MTAYDTAIDAIAGGPTWHCKFGEASGTVAAARVGPIAEYAGSDVTYGVTGLVGDNGSDTAVSFSGAGGKAQVAQAFAEATFDGAAFTYSLRHTPGAATGSNKNIFSRTGYGLYLDATNKPAIFCGASFAAYVAADAVVEGTPITYTVTFDGTTWKVYVDTTEVISQADTRVTGGPLGIGVYPGNAGDANGTFDEPKFWPVALSAAEVGAVVDADTAVVTGTYADEVLADTPYVYLPLDGDTTDASGNGRNGTGTGVTYTTGLLAAGGQSVQGGAAVTVATPALTPGIPVTGEILYQPIAADLTPGNDLALWTKVSAGGVPSPLSIMITSGKVRVLVGDGGSNYRVHDSATTLTADTTYHIAAALADGSGDPVLYLNGASETLNFVFNSSALSWSDGGDPIHAGQRSDGNDGVSGVYGHGAWYTSVLSAARIAAHADAVSTPAAAGVEIDLSDLDLSNDEQQKTALIRLADAVGLSLVSLDLSNHGHRQTIIKQVAVAEGVDTSSLNLGEETHQRAFIVGRASGSVVPPFDPGPAPSFIEGSDAPGAAAAMDALYGGAESGSWLTTKLPDNTAVAPNSAAAVAYINAMFQAYGGWLNGVINGNFTSVINVVPADQPLVPVVPRGNLLSGNNPGLQFMFEQGVPIPPGIPPFPEGDTDAELVIIQPDWERTIGGVTYRGRMYEMWVAVHPSTSPSGEWECYWGGRAAGTDGWLSGHWFDWWWGDAASPNGFEAEGIAWDHNMGAQATSIPIAGTILSRLDVVRGVIKHPLHYEMPLVPTQADQVGNVWPAQRWDGGSYKDCPHGTRMRLPAGYTIDPGWPWLTQLIATAVRDYGMVQTDTVGPTTGPTFRLEPGAADLVPGGVDISAIMNAFPWADLEVIAVGDDVTYNPTV